MNDFASSTAVVTGAASGIGRALVHALAREGANVVATDVEGDVVRAVADEVAAMGGGQAIGVSADVARFEDMERVRSEAHAEFGSVQLLFNNAGVSVRRRGMHASMADWEWVMGVNLWGAIHGIAAFLPDMLASGREGHIVNTSSMNGIVPSAFSAMYSCSKYGVMGLTETLRNELRETPVGISALCPAGVVTRIHESERNRPEHLRTQEGTAAHVPSSSFELSPPLTPDAVATLTLEGIRRNQLYIFTDLKVRDLIEQHHKRMVEDFDHLAQQIGSVQA